MTAFKRSRRLREPGTLPFFLLLNVTSREKIPVFCRGVLALTFRAAYADLKVGATRTNISEVSDRRGRSEIAAPPRSHIQLLHLLRRVLRGAPGKSHNRERRVFVGVADEGSAVGDKEVLAIPRLAIRIHHGSRAIRSHAGSPYLMDDSAPFADAPIVLRPEFPKWLSSRRQNDFLKGLAGIFRHLYFIFAPLEMESKDRDAPRVDHVLVDFAVAVVIGDHLAATDRKSTRLNSSH